MWVATCPRHCKKWRRLGAFETETEARHCIQQHLQHSSLHYLKADQATEEAWACDKEVYYNETEVPPDAAEEAMPEREEGSAAGSAQKRPRLEDAEPTRLGPVPEDSSVTRLRVMMPALQVCSDVRLSLLESTLRSETALRNAARMSRAAYLAFEDEANRVANLTRSLRNGMN